MGTSGENRVPDLLADLRIGRSRPGAKAGGPGIVEDNVEVPTEYARDSPPWVKLNDSSDANSLPDGPDELFERNEAASLSH